VILAFSLLTVCHHGKEHIYLIHAVYLSLLLNDLKLASSVINAVTCYVMMFTRVTLALGLRLYTQSLCLVRVLNGVSYKRYACVGLLQCPFHKTASVRSFPLPASQSFMRFSNIDVAAPPLRRGMMNTIAVCFHSSRGFTLTLPGCTTPD